MKTIVQKQYMVMRIQPLQIVLANMEREIALGLPPMCCVRSSCKPVFIVAVRRAALILAASP